jgi:DHA1 family multidrug resistance protein-like MFS transporter
MDPIDTSVPSITRMPGALRGPLWALFVVATAYGLVLPVLPALLGSAVPGGVAAATGALMATYTLATVVASPLWGWLLDRFPARRLLLIGLLGQGLVQLALWWPPSLTTLVVIRALQGALGAVAVPAVLTLAAQWCPPALYGAAVARVSRAALLGGLAGPLLGGVLAQGASLRLPVAVATGLILIAAVAIARVDGTPVGASAETVAPTADRPRLWLLGAAAMIAGMAMGAMEVGISVRGREALGLSASSIGLMFSGCGLVMILVQTGVFRPQRDPASLWRLLAPAFLISALGVGVLRWASETWMLSAVVVLVAAGGGVLLPTISLWIVRSAGRAHGLQLGLRAALGGLGQAAGALLAGVAFRAQAPQTVWIVIVVGLAVGIALALARRPPGPESAP